jgi:hypothetical protein
MSDENVERLKLGRAAPHSDFLNKYTEVDSKPLRIGSGGAFASVGGQLQRSLPMFRVVCAWALLVLAASPFTAPFSTCDVGAFLGAEGHALVLPSGRLVLAVATAPVNGDALSLSPIISRVQLPADRAATLLDLPASRAVDRAFRVTLGSPYDLKGPSGRNEPPGRLSVLRL